MEFNEQQFELLKKTNVTAIGAQKKAKRPILYE